MKPLLFAAVLACAAPGLALAQEAIPTARGDAPAAQAVGSTDPAPDTVTQNAIWARRVMEGAADPERVVDQASDRPGCERDPDRRVHGEVHAGVGTRGYREAGGVATMPVGKCGSATIAVDYGRIGRR